MKNKKGFTLTELLVVLVLMVLLMTLAFPNFADLTTKAKSNYERSTQIIIKNAAKMYVNNNKEEIEQELKKGTYCLPIGKLIAYEYLDADLKESNNQSIPSQRCVYVSSNSGKYEYRIGTTSSDVVSSGVDYLPPIITITGNECKSVMNVNTIEDYDNTCTVKATDNNYSAKTFKKIREKEDVLTSTQKASEIELSKVVSQEKNVIYINYHATDPSGNKAIPLQVQLTLPE